jgi:hypothetical protein
MQYMRGLKLEDDRQRVHQRDIIDALEKVREARREHILVSEDDAGNLRFVGLVVIGLCLLTWIGLVHSDNRRSCDRLRPVRHCDRDVEPADRLLYQSAAP